MADDYYPPIDASGRSYVADLGGAELKFSRKLSARQELALLERADKTADEALDIILGAIRHMAPDQDDIIDQLPDRYGSDDILRLLGDASRAVRANPTGEPSGSSPQAESGGDIGVAAPV